MGQPAAPLLPLVNLPVLSPQPMVVNRKQPAANSASPSVVDLTKAAANPVTQLSGQNAMPFQVGGGAGGTANPYGGAAVEGGANRGPAQAGGIVLPVSLAPSVIQPHVLEQPKEFAGPPEGLPVIALDSESLLGFPRFAETQPADREAVPALSDNSLGMLGVPTLTLSVLQPEEKTPRLADLSLQVLTYAPLGPSAALPGFAPFRILPWRAGEQGYRPPSFSTEFGEHENIPAYGRPNVAHYGASNIFNYGAGIGAAISAAQNAAQNLRPHVPGLGRINP
jgi:hypothetical protein